jgi:hypothetical protein
VRGPDDDSRLNSVWLPEGQEVADEMTVEAVLVVVHHKGWVTPAGKQFPSVVEYRLTKARQLR